jgi:cobaltochelatase CobT
MRGKPIITSAITTEIITKVLEKCKVNVEVLGFTTKEWKGGKSKKKWETSGKIEKPGRLNDLLHIIYKDADSTWNNCKNNLGLILKDGLLKENIDGEAVQWAYRRLMNRKEKKKILIVISDGAPVDDSTLSNNPPNILDNHLKETVIRIQNTKTIKLVAIGIGHDVSKYYKNAFIIDDAENLGDIIIDNLMKFLGTKNI